VAVVSQPCDRKASVPLPGELDSSLNEFWSNNPWDIVKNGHNLSAFERKRVWINHQGKGFLDYSHLTGADNDGDGRSVVAADFRNTGQNDLIVRQIGGGSLLLYENNFPVRHYLKVSLRGTQSSRAGVGARLIARAGSLQMLREMYPYNSYLSQAPNIVHFGLGDAEKVDQLTIRWPSGKEQILSNIKSNQHILVTEGKEGAEAVEVITPGKTIEP
jgi:hypothetical protein